MRGLYFLPLTFILTLVVFFAVQNDRLRTKNEFAKFFDLNMPVPEFTVPTANKKLMLKSSELKGKNIINFFASWCLTCIEENIHLMELKKNNIPVYGLVWKDDNTRVQRWLKEHGNPYRKIGFDKDGSVGVNFGITGIPETYIIENNKIVSRYAGPIDAAAKEDIIKWFQK